MIWKNVKGYENLYQVSNTGKVRSLDRIINNKTKNNKLRKCQLKGRLLKPYTRNDGRLMVVLSKCGEVKSHNIHVLVATAFMGDPGKKYEVNHIDGDYQNNHIDNLEWVTRKENMRHAFANELYSTMKKVAEVNNGRIIKVYPSESSACRSVGVSQGKIGRSIRRNGTCAGKTWKYVDESVTTTENWVKPS